jgi:hypothetical protein
MLLRRMLAEFREEIPRCGFAHFVMFKERHPILRRTIWRASYWRLGFAMHLPHLSILSRSRISECIKLRGWKD